MSYADDDWAVFWCSLLAPILLEEVEPGERNRFLQDLSQQEVTLPNGRRKRISLSTLRRKVRRFRQQKIAGLRRKQRGDRGQPRKRRQAMLQRAIELKREQPRRSPRTINEFLKQEFGRTIPKSTMNWHLRRAGATRRKLGVSDEKTRCRWTRDHSNALWVGDFSQGPCVFHANQVIKSHLSIWIDCYSRYVVEGRYYFRENLDILIDSLLRAWASHGVPREIYVDNAKVYHSRALKLACAQLNIQLLHRPPRDPSPGGVIERVIQTTQQQFESEIQASHTVTLDKLNRYFQAWLHASYHQTEHSSTGQAPRQRFHQQTRFRRSVNMSEALELFRCREKRKVDDEFCDVRINNRFFAAELKYRGDQVLVSYDPFSNLDEVRLYSLEEQFLQVAPRYERERGTHPFVSTAKPTASNQTPLDHEYLKLLEARHQEQLRQEAQHGIDYHRAQTNHLLTLAQFLNAFAKLLGRKGGASGLSTHELELLGQVHRSQPRITTALLEKAFQRAEHKTIPVIVFHLQNRLSA
jgi:transposase InsO family protein